jgi:hypothetical protein
MSNATKPTLLFYYRKINPRSKWKFFGNIFRRGAKTRRTQRTAKRMNENAPKYSRKARNHNGKKEFNHGVTRSFTEKRGFSYKNSVKLRALRGFYS